MTKLLRRSIQYDKVFSTFGQQQLVMVNYTCDFNRSETGKILRMNNNKIQAVNNIPALHEGLLLLPQQGLAFLYLKAAIFVTSFSGPHGLFISFVGSSTSLYNI